MRRSRSMTGSDDDSQASGPSTYSLRSTICPSTQEPSWRNTAYRAQTGAPVMTSRSLCHDKRFLVRNDFATMNRNISASSFRIRYYKFSKRRIQLGLMIIFTIVVVLIHQDRYASNFPLHEEDSDALKDETLTMQEDTYFTLEQHPTSKKNPIKIYNSSPVIELSNGMTFPLVGTSLANIDSRKLPMVVATQLNIIHNSSRQYKHEHKNPHDGAIALIALENSSFNSNNGAVVARAIMFFNKKRNEKIKLHHQESSFTQDHRGLALRGYPELDSYSETTIDNEYEIESDILEIHIATTIPRAHLGYGRTRLALDENLKLLGTVLPQPSKLSDSSPSDHTNVNVHVLLHSPRCEGGDTWVNCEKEEDRVVDAHIKEAGPSPNSTSWKESWKVLEEAYSEERVKSIGVSNFNLSELNELLKTCTINPHFYHGSIWSILFDQKLMALLKEHEILFQVSNIMKGIIERRDITPIAYQYLLDISFQIDDHKNDLDEEEKSTQELHMVIRLILAWLVQRGVVVTPQVSSLDNLAENSPSLIGSFSELSSVLDLEIETAVKAIVTGDDLPKNFFRHEANNSKKRLKRNTKLDHNDGMVYIFENPFDQSVSLYRGYCENGDCGSEVSLNYDIIQIVESIEPKEQVRFVVYPGDDFILYDQNGYELEKVSFDYAS